jgi:hypothetical protein
MMAVARLQSLATQITPFISIGVERVQNWLTSWR